MKKRPGLANFKKKKKKKSIFWAPTFLLCFFAFLEVEPESLRWKLSLRMSA